MVAVHLGFFQIYVMNADGSDVRQLTFPDLAARTEGTGPEWSPDGAKIAFQWSRRVAEESEVFVMNADGTNQTEPHEFTRYKRWRPCLVPRRQPDRLQSEIDPAGPLRGVHDATGRERSISPLGKRIDDWQPIVNAPPDCSGVAARPNVLWPPNKHLRTVSLSGATDPDGDNVTLRVRA